MAKISTYQIAGGLSLSDMLIGTDVENDNATKNFSLGDIYSLFNELNPPACCSYYNMNTIQVGVINFPFFVPFNTELISQGIYVDGGSIYFESLGVYIVNVKLRAVHTGGGGDARVSVCLRNPGGAIDYSLQTFTIPNTHTQTIDYSFMLNVNGLLGSQFEVSWFTDNLNVKLMSSAEVGQYEPASPSSLLNIYKVAPFNE